MAHKNEKGFTLVELAIVMAIIGLLIGGILKGQELMESARITSLISQVRSYEAAVTTFGDTYGAVPGDMTNADTRIPNCNALCHPDSGIWGNTIVGIPNRGGRPQGMTAALARVPHTGSEHTLFWTHLLLADLIGGVTDTAIHGGGAAWGESHPAAQIGGGFYAGHLNGTTSIGVPGHPGPTPSGLVLVLRNAIVGQNTANAGEGVLSPFRAAQIDRKMDDGKPGIGFVHSYGTTASCHAGAGPANLRTYLEQGTSKDCGLVIRIQG